MKKGDEITEKIELIFNTISENPEITVKGLASLLDLTQKQTENSIKILKETNRIHREGSARNGKWIID